MASTGNRKQDWFDIPAAAEYVNRSQAYIRQLVRDGTFETKKQPIEPGYEVKKHMIHVSVLDAYLVNPNKRNRRDDGRNKYYAYMTPKEFSEAIRILKSAGPHMTKVAELIVPANIRKPDMED